MGSIKMNPSTPNVVCGVCKIPMILDTMGINVAEVSDGQPPRIIYKSAADKYVCPSCGFSILNGFGGAVIDTHKNFNIIPVEVTTFSSNHSMTFDEIESILSELNMLKMGLEMKRDNLIAYTDSQLRNKIRRRKKK